MLRASVAFVALLTLTNSAVAEYMLLKVDLNQIPFSNLRNIDAPLDLLPVDGPRRWVYGAFDYKKLPYFYPDLEKKELLVFDHRWGQRACVPGILVTGDNVKNVDRLQKESALELFRAKRKVEYKPNSPNPDAVLRLAAWALTHGLAKEFHSSMADLKKASPTRPAVLAYEKLLAEMKKTLAAEDPVQAALLTDLRQGFRFTQSKEGHYTLLYKDGGDFTEPALDRRKKRLEETFNNFFYWFALQEKLAVPPLPTARLHVLVDLPHEFKKRQQECGFGQVQTNAFVLRRENLMVLAAKPTDDDYEFLDKNITSVRSDLGLSMEEMISGAVWNRPFKAQSIPAAIQTLTLLQKVMEDEAEIAAINREGVHQLLGATGMLSRNVSPPQWLLFGFTSFFETPVGSLHANFGLPSTSNLVAFKRLRKKMGKSADVLVNLATDHYFHQARADFAHLREMDKKDLNKRDRDRLLVKVKESEDLAQSTAWAFVYYLALHQKIPNLRRYTDQLNALPRHMDLSPHTLQTCFARAFDLEDPRSPGKIDPGKAAVLAEAWFQDINTLSLENAELERFHDPDAKDVKSSP